MENLIKKYGRAKRWQYACSAIVAFAALALLEFVAQPFTWLHGARHIPLTHNEGYALLTILAIGLCAGFGLNYATFKVMWPIERQIFEADIAEQVRAKVKAITDAEDELMEARLEWLRKKAIYAEKKRRARNGRK